MAADLVSRGVATDAERVIIATSGQQAVDLAVRALVEPGDAVLCETPTYAGAIDALVAARARIVPVPVDAFGSRPTPPSAPRSTSARACSTSTRRRRTRRARSSRPTGARGWRG